MSIGVIIGFIIYILFTHFVADFMVQTDEQAKGKSTSIYWLTQHILGYGYTSLVSIAILIAIYSVFGYILTFELISYILFYIILNMGLHWVTDYFTSKQTKRLWDAGQVHNFFVMIGLDQFIHATCLIVTFWLIFLL